jgi:hypothetical protein
MIEQMEKDVFYSTLCNLLLVFFISQFSQLSNGLASQSDVITGVMRDKDRGVVAAEQPGDRLYKHILFIAALDCVAAFLTPSLISVEVACRGRQLAASSYLAQILILSPK